MTSKKEHKSVIMTFYIAFLTMIIGGTWLIIISYPGNNKWTDPLVILTGFFMIIMGIVYFIWVILWEKRNPHDFDNTKQ